MDITLEIPEYSPERGFEFKWQYYYGIKVEITDDKEVIISANKDGLISLATHLLTLAQDSIPPTDGHFHLTEYDALEEGSSELIVQKMPDVDTE